MNWQEIIPGKVAIKFNQQQKLFHYFSLGEITGGSLFPHTKNTTWNIEINITPEPASHISGDFQQFSTFYKVGKDWILYERTYGGLRCQMLVENITSHNPSIYVNSFYLNRIRAKIDNLYPPGIHLTDILLYQIISSGDLVVHGASLHNPATKGSFLIVAPPDTGKTYTTYMLLQKGFKFLGEDLSYYDAKTNELRCMPYTSTWGHRFSVKKVDISKVPFVGLVANSSKKGVEDLFGRKAVQESSPLKRIYLIEKANTTSIEKVSADRHMMRKIMAIQRNEFSYYKNPLLRAFEYYNDNLNVDNAFDMEASSMRKLFDKVDVFLVQAPRSEDFEGLILKAEATQEKS